VGAALQLSRVDGSVVRLQVAGAREQLVIFDVHLLLAEALDAARHTIEEHRAPFDRLVAGLLASETLERAALDELLDEPASPQARTCLPRDVHGGSEDAQVSSSPNEMPTSRADRISEPFGSTCL
jgi:hypothetical protein